MDRNTFWGGSPLAVLLRLALMSVVVGVVLNALGINVRNFFDRINTLLRNLYELGFNAIDWALQYLLVGAIVVVPIWLVSRLVAMGRNKPE